MAAALRELADFLLPCGCVACGAWIPARGEEGLVCGLCRSRLDRGTWPRCPRCHWPRGSGRAEGKDCLQCRGWDEALGWARWAVVLRSPADDLVHALKYEGWGALARELGTWMRRWAPPPAEAGATMVVPVPTTAARRARRGYNQAALLARRYAELLDLPVVEALERTRGGATQVSLHPSQRLANVWGAFAPRPGERRRIEGASAVLVDDVLTTGATAASAARTLLEAGAVRVGVATFARAFPGVGGRR